MQNTIFITGASSGLGKAAAKHFHDQGWTVIATMRRPEEEKDLVQLSNVKLYALDVTDEQQINACISEILRMYDVDVVLNNAGYGLIGPLEAFSTEQIQQQIQTNLLGVIHISRAFTPYFRERNFGTFINVTSTFGLLGYPLCTLYNATKFAVDGFSESLAYELAQFNIKVKVVAPGGMKTDFAGRSLQGVVHNSYDRLAAIVSEGYSEEQIVNYTPAEEVAAIIFGAATDGSGRLRYVAGKDANTLYNERLELSPEGQFGKMRPLFM
ncbi:SDR family oxidoreductase [uncultured Chryseobacterium sp.]|uniref:SDR family oxidoreductase n=1 Tax=uncultured Chryseobacterium sp. TaxID=259322 RepID=UPI00258EB27B|nr:SDR family oxidoreductase [uncultured Chryseobacterium sp.]